MKFFIVFSVLALSALSGEATPFFSGSSSGSSSGSVSGHGSGGGSGGGLGGGIGNILAYVI